MALFLTLISYLLVFLGVRYLVRRIFGKDAPFSRLVTGLATVALAPRFRYEGERGERALEARWLLLGGTKRLKSYEALPETADLGDVETAELHEVDIEEDEGVPPPAEAEEASEGPLG